MPSVSTEESPAACGRNDSSYGHDGVCHGIDETIVKHGGENPIWGWFKHMIGDSMRGRHEHLGCKCRGSACQNPTKESWIGKHIVDLVGKITPPRRHNKGPARLRFVGHDLRNGIGERANDRTICHRANLLSPQKTGLRHATEDIRTAKNRGEISSV